SHKPGAGALSFCCASFCSNYGKAVNFKQGIYKDKDHRELIG
ncbi:20671_t:CDS:1, partial [Gigaspora rosea]